MGGYKKITPEEGKGFSKDYQPSPEAKKAGWAKRKALKEISEMIVSGDNEGIAKSMAILFGIDPKDIDVETLADLRQLEKAIKKGDTSAYNAYKDRLRGKPQQKVITEDLNAEPIPAMKWREESDS